MWICHVVVGAEFGFTAVSACVPAPRRGSRQQCCPGPGLGLDSQAPLEGERRPVCSRSSWECVESGRKEMPSLEKRMV